MPPGFVPTSEWHIRHVQALDILAKAHRPAVRCEQLAPDGAFRMGADLGDLRPRLSPRCCLSRLSDHVSAAAREMQEANVFFSRLASMLPAAPMADSAA
jgi:hypothetical protein